MPLKLIRNHLNKVQILTALKIVSNQAGRADLAVSDLAKIQVIPAYNIHEVSILQLQEFTTVVPLFSTFKSCTGSLIVSSSRIPTIPCLIADSLALRALYSARDIVVKGALVAQWASIVVTFLLPLVASIFY
ncbi:hypothetical protein Tco_1541315 [Tanacetum coccineum]